MHVLRKGAVVAALAGTVLAVVPLWAQTTPPPHAPLNWLPDHDWSGQWCRYTGPKKRSSTNTQQSVGKVTTILETEAVAGENDSFAKAQIVAIAPAPVNPVNIDLKGTVHIGADVDLYRFTATKGDVLGCAVIAEASLNPTLAIQQLSQISLIENDDHSGIASMYPPGSPFPGGVGLYDSALTWIVPADGDYLIRVGSYLEASRGTYTLQIRARRPSMEDQNLGGTQVIFIDFDGATVNAQGIWGYSFARNPATLSPLRDFMGGWGLGPEDEAAVVDAVITTVENGFDALRLASLNGNRDIDSTAGHFDVQVLNSRDHADPFGQPNVSRVIVGGTIDQLGIPTIGIAQSIDPGNFDREETAVVLLDLLSSPREYVWNGQTYLNLDSINAIDIAGNLTKIDVIGQAVGNIVVHEAGHYLGNWHTDNQNEVPCIMDKGGVGVPYITGAGPDNTLGSADDQLMEYVYDVFDPFEMVAVGEESTNVNTAFAMATGRVQREVPPEVPTWPYPLSAVRASPTSGSPPLSVQFWAGGIDDSARDLTFTWDFTDGSAAASGPVVTHVFETPGEFLVKVTATNLDGVKGQTTILIKVSANLPTARVVATPVRGPAPLTVNFSGEGSTAVAGNIVKYEWDLGDGNTASGATVQHTYNSQGYYAAKLIVTDSFGGVSTASSLITVNAPVQGFDAAQSATSTESPTAPQCGLGSGVMMVSSLAGLLALMGVRRRY